MAVGAGSSLVDVLVGALVLLVGAVFLELGSCSASDGATFCSWSLRVRVTVSNTNKTKIVKFFISFLIL